MVDLESLQALLESYLYFGDYGFLAMGSGLGNGSLRVTIDSATFTESTSMLCAKGTVAESRSADRIQGAQVVVGIVQQFESRIIDKSRNPPTLSHHYRITPHHENTTDSEGRFALCAKIDSASSLMIASQSFFVKLYNVGS